MQALRLAMRGTLEASRCAKADPSMQILARTSSLVLLGKLCREGDILQIMTLI